MTQASVLPQERPAARSARSMPTLLAVAKHHGVADREPFCFRCGDEPDVAAWSDANSYLERAHIIDRVFDGLDVPQNLAPLCKPCHKEQPAFRAGDEVKALAWFGLPLAADDFPVPPDLLSFNSPADALAAGMPPYHGAADWLAARGEFVAKRRKGEDPDATFARRNAAVERMYEIESSTTYQPALLAI